MAAEISPRAWRDIALFLPYGSAGGVNKLTSYICRNFWCSDEDGQLDADYLDSDGFRIQSGIYSLDESVDAIFSQGSPITLADTAHIDRNLQLVAPIPKALIHAIVQRFKAVASEPHHFRAVHACYRSQGRYHTSTLEGMYESVFPCWRCDATYIPHRCYNGERRVGRAHSMRFHLATVSGLHLTLELTVVLHLERRQGCMYDLVFFIFEHDGPLCRALITPTLPALTRPALQNRDVRLEVFKFLTRFDVDKAQRCSRRWCDFVSATANTLALYDVEFDLRMNRGAHVNMWNWSVNGIRPHYRLFDLSSEPTPTIIHNLIRNSACSVKFHTDASHWQCLPWILRGTTNCSVYQLNVELSGVKPGLNSQSLQEAVELGGVRSLRLMFYQWPHPLDYASIVACGSTAPIEKLTLRIHGALVSHVSWIVDLVSSSKISAISISLRFFTDTLELCQLSLDIAQVFVVAPSLRDLPASFVLDVFGATASFEAPEGTPVFNAPLTLPHAVPHPAGAASSEFETTVFHLRNARSRDYVTFLIGTKTQQHRTSLTLRVFKGQLRLPSGSY